MAERIDLIYRLTRLLSRSTFWPLFAIRREGVNHLPQAGGFVLLPKHQRWEDIPLLSLACPRPLYYVAKAELFSNAKAHSVPVMHSISREWRRRRPETASTLRAVLKSRRGKACLGT